MNDSFEMKIDLSEKEIDSSSKKKPINKKKSSYIVEDIIEKKKINNHWMYLIKWKDFPTEQSTWEPRKNIENLGNYLKKFDKEWSEKSEDVNSNISPVSKKRPKKSAKKVRKINSQEKSKLNENETDIEVRNMTSSKKKKEKDTTDFVNTRSSRTNEFRETRITPTKKAEENSGSKSKLSKQNSSVMKVSTRKRIKKINKSNTNHINIINNISNSNGEKNIMDKLFGSLEKNDIPDEIIDFKIEQNNFYFLISWKIKNGKKLIPSYITEKEMENDHHQILYEFYKKAFSQYALIRKISSNPFNI